MSKEKIKISVASLNTAGVASTLQLVDTTKNDLFIITVRRDTSEIERQRIIYSPSFIKSPEKESTG